jgi:hypothetical protein
MQNKSSHKELPFDVEDAQYLQEVTLVENVRQDLGDNLPVGFEDFLYETWKESRICNQKEMKGNIDKLPESN